MLSNLSTVLFRFADLIVSGDLMKLEHGVALSLRLIEGRTSEIRRRIRLELSLHLKGLLFLREAGFAPEPDPDAYPKCRAHLRASRRRYASNL